MLKYHLNQDLVYIIVDKEANFLLYKDKYVFIKDENFISLINVDKGSFTINLEGSSSAYFRLLCNDNNTLYNFYSKDNYMFNMRSINDNNANKYNHFNHYYVNDDLVVSKLENQELHLATIKSYGKAKRDKARYKLYQYIEDDEKRIKTIRTVWEQFGEPTLKKLKKYLPEEYYNYLTNDEFNKEKNKQIVEFILNLKIEKEIKEKAKEESVNVLLQVGNNKNISEKIIEFVEAYLKEKNIYDEDLIFKIINEYICEYDFFDIETEEDLSILVNSKDEGYKIIEEIVNNIYKDNEIGEKIDEFVESYLKEKNIYDEDLYYEILDSYIYEYDFFLNIETKDDLEMLITEKNKGYKILSKIVKNIYEHNKKLLDSIEYIEKNDVDIYSSEEFKEKFIELYDNNSVCWIERKINLITKRIEKIIIFKNKVGALLKYILSKNK